MAYQYCYTIYDFHWPDAQQERLDLMVADGWQIHTANPASSEVYVVWQRELPGETAPAAQETPDSGSRDSLGRFTAAPSDSPGEPAAGGLRRPDDSPGLTGEQISGELQAHEGQGAR
jgi:hypothetical protein